LRQIDPEHPSSLGARLHAQIQLCDWENHDAAVAAIVQAVELEQDVDFGGPFLALHDSPNAQLRWATRMCRQHRAKVSPLWTGEIYRHARIRVAYVSADFLEHPTAYLLAGILEKHDRSRFETIGIVLREDAASPMARRVLASFDHVVVAGSRSDLELAMLMRRMEIDIAVDLMGYTAEHRTNVFAYRPAPVQVSYLGFPATLGTSDIDYLIADDFMIPEQHRADYSEQIAYLPECFQANDDQRLVSNAVPTRAAVGLPADGFVWCSFHSCYKFNPLTFSIWMRLLQAVPDSVLWLVGGNPLIERNLRQAAVARGVSAERIVFAQRLPYPQHLARLRLADLCLDTWPYNGGATSSDVLWAGVPIVTCAGRSYAARMTGSLLQALDLPELIAADFTDYERIAYELASSRQHLAMIRNKLARNARTGPLFDSDRFRRHLEAAYTAMLERVHANAPPACLRIPALPTS
jgi:protein O-GlcNAc transferase